MPNVASGDAYEKDANGQWVRTPGGTKDLRTGDVLDTNTGPFTDTFGQLETVAYEPNVSNFNFGGQAGYANRRAGELSNHAGGLESNGYQVGANLRSQGMQGNTAGQGAATRYNALGANTVASQGNLANQYANQGQQGMALQNARALGFGQQGTTGAAAGAARAGTQQGQATNLQNQAYNLGNTYGDRSALAMGRGDVGVTNQYDNFQNRNLEAEGRAQQLQAAQALGYRANDNSGYQNTQGFRDFAAQTGNGPSAAQAQMQQGADQSMASSLALARSGRGNNTGAVRQAMFQNAATQQATNQQLGTLRAQEYDQAENRQLGALNSESSALQGYRGQDLNALQGAAGVLGQARGQDQSQQQLGIGQGQYDANMALQNRQLNDATALGWAGQQQAAAQQQQNAWQAGQQLGNQSIAQGQQYNLGLQGLGQQASQAGQQYDLGKGQLQNQAIGQGQNFQLGTGQLANQAVGQGQNYNLGAQGLANNYALGTQQGALGHEALANQTYGQQLSADMGYEGLRSSNFMQAQVTNAQADQQRDAGNVGAMGGLFQGALMMSDEREKGDKRSTKMAPFFADLFGGGGQIPGPGDLPFISDIPGISDLPAPPPLPGLPELPGLPGMQSSQQPPPRSSSKSSPSLLSDENSKREISRLNGKLAEAYNALGGSSARGSYAGAYQGSNLPDTEYPNLPNQTHFDSRRAGRSSTNADAVALGYQGNNMPDTEYPSMPQNTRFQPRVDMRSAQGFSYDYKDPSAPGAAPGKHYGPMAQDLEKSPATASTVITGADGVKRVDPGRLTMLNTAALSDQQRDIQAIKQALASNNSALTPTQSSQMQDTMGDPWHPKGDVNVDALDEAYRRQAGGGAATPQSWRDLDPLGEQYANRNWRYAPGF